MRVRTGQSPRVVAVALCAATIAGALLRLWNLSFESLWIDEIWSGYLVSGSPIDVIGRLITEDNHPPLYHLLQWPFPRIFTVDAGLRLPSAIFGILAIPLIFAVGRRLFDEHVGLLSAVFLALSPFAVHAGRDARYYSLLLFLSLLAILAFLRLRQRQDRSSAVLLGLALALVLYTQYMGGLFVAALLLTAFFMGGEVRRGAVWAGIVAFALFLPWLLAARAGFGNVMGNYWILPPTAKTVAVALGSLAVLGRFPWSWPVAPAVLISLCWLIAVVLGARGARDRGPARFCVLLLVLPVLAELAISTVRPLFLTRTLIPIVPPLLLLAAKGALSLPRPKLAAILLAATLLPGSLALHLVHHNENWRGAIGYLAARIEPGEVIVVDPFHSRAVAHYGRNVRAVRQAPVVLLPPHSTVDDVPGLIRDRLGFEPRSFWLVIRTCDREDTDTRDRAMRTLRVTADFEENAAAALRFIDPAKR